MKRLRYSVLVIACLFMLLMPWQAQAKAVGLSIGKTPYGNAIYPSMKQNVFYHIAEDDSDYYTYYVYKTDITSAQTSCIAELHARYDPYSFWYQNDKIYYVEQLSYISGDKSTFNVSCLDLQTGQNSVLFTKELTGECSKAIGVDSVGRIYIATNFTDRLIVYDHSGNELARSEEGLDADELIGFDPANNNIYFRGTTNWVYWGYDHYMACLKVARIQGNSITWNDKSITIFYQQYFYTHYGCAELLDGRYLADLTTFGGDTLFLLDSGKINPSDVTDTSTTISLVDSGVSVSGVNLKDKSAVKMAVTTMDSEYQDYTDISSVGTRCTYSSKDDLLLVASEAKSIEVYRPDGTSVGTLATEYPIYKLMMINGQAVALERSNGAYYIETFDLTLPTKINISGEESLKAGGHAAYTADVDSDLKVEIQFESSAPEILSIDDKGNASAWSAGTVTITAYNKDRNLTCSMTVTVEDRKGSADSALTSGNGQKTDNDRRNEYNTYGDIVGSYLVQISANKLMRVESNGKSVLVEYLSPAGKVLSEKTIKNELQMFGGFFAGKDAYYLVFGQTNASEDDEKEVIRVVKYSKDWKRSGACSIRNINTTVPFDAGSLRMTETDGVLYIHTCHEMYESSDGYNHQANMTFEIYEDTMELKDSYSDVMNLGVGYVSHSFNQFIQTDGQNIYRVDHGDAYPRGIALTVYPKDGQMSSPTSYGTVESFDDAANYNYTGASLGGFELSASHAIIAFNRDVSIGNSGVRNIQLASVDKQSLKQSIQQVTNYKVNSKVTCGTPQLVKIDDYHFLLMWMEYDNSKGTQNCALAQVNNQGRVVSPIYRKNIRLSDCKPIALEDGTVCWYVTNGTSMKMYRIDPYRLQSIKEEPVSITLEKKVTLEVGEKVVLSPTLKTEYAVTDLKWSSDKKSVATVSSKGTVTAKKKGTAKITVTTDNGLSKVCTVKVVAASTPQTAAPVNVKNASSVKKSEKEILQSKKEEAPKGSSFSILQLQGSKVTGNSITLKWTKVKGASGYIIYGNTCGKSFKKLKTIKSGNTTTWTHKKLKKGKYYKYLVVATAKYNGSTNAIATSKACHIVTSGGKYGNDKSVSLSNVTHNQLKLKKGKTFTIKAAAIPASAQKKVNRHRGLAFESTNTSIATVSSKGKVKAKKKGTCYIYVYAQNGVWERVKVTVK